MFEGSETSASLFLRFFICESISCFLVFFFREDRKKLTYLKRSVVKSDSVLASLILFIIYKRCFYKKGRRIHRDTPAFLCKGAFIWCARPVSGNKKVGKCLQSSVLPANQWRLLSPSRYAVRK